ncbi:MAG TPA: proline/glycine betaine ABC transporter permease [Ochrobactrum intermedium]|uniref:Proline/glycine betaine ABC transporter permease n=1 Tax=Brucella intermedia TaxID=94625 RepID=A0A7V6PBV3_9HYPH|nr:proline/glycine betaine ABC transporter permease [Brucella intermedia]HHV68035.1 proline/glycine betaine ABC transporter permease [Brucella intermedia]
MFGKDFPPINEDLLRVIKQTVDQGFLNFTRSYGDIIEWFFSPLAVLLNTSERVFTNAPWLVIILSCVLLAWVATRKLSVSIFVASTLILIGLFGMWENTMKTLSMILVSTLIAIILGLPTGVLMARSDRVQRAINPLLDVMQTMPSFVYLIPVVMLLGIGRVPGLIAVVIYAVPPMIRLTNLGIRTVDADILEASDAFGASRAQKLWTVQLPLAMPSIMAGVNQTIMMALAMVVIASMIGVQGLGQPVLRAINSQYFTLGIFNGLAIVGIAMAIDRITQGYGARLQKHTGDQNGAR